MSIVNIFNDSCFHGMVGRPSYCKIFIHTDNLKWINTGSNSQKQKIFASQQFSITSHVFCSTRKCQKPQLNFWVGCDVTIEFFLLQNIPLPFARIGMGESLSKSVLAPLVRNNLIYFACADISY